MMPGGPRGVRPRPKTEDDGSFNMGTGPRLVPTSPSPSHVGVNAAAPGRHLSDVEDYASGRTSVNSNNNASFLPEITNTNKGGSRASQQTSQSQMTPFWAYGSGSGGSVDHWKKLVKKAELEKHLEQEQHRAHREKDLDAIQRLKSRVSALEAAAQERDVIIEKQRRKISFLKSQLGGANKRFGKELSILRNQSEQMRLKIASLNETKILELKEELQLSESKRKILENQLGLIHKCIEDPLEVFNLTELHERAPEPVRPDKSPKRSSKRQAPVENEIPVQGFDDFTIPKDELQANVNDSIQMFVKKKQTKTTLAGKILQMRTENNLLQRQIGQRDERLKALFNEAEHLRRQLKDAIASRNSALNQVKETERLFEKLESMEPLIVKAGIISEHDINSSTEDIPGSPTKGRRTPDFEAFTAELDEANGKLTRKQAFRKWSNTLNKIRSALLTFVTKVHNTSQLEAHLKTEEDSLSMFMKKLQNELTSELDVRTVENAEEMDKIRGQEQADYVKIVPRKSGTGGILDREVMTKVVVAVREQTRKLEIVTSRVEELKKEKISLEASAFSRQKRISDLERKVDQLRSEEDIFKCYIMHMRNMVAHVDETPYNEDDDRIEINLPLGGDQDIQSLDKKINNKYKVHSLVRKLENVLNEVDELKIEFRKLKSQFGGAWSELNNLRDCFAVLEISIDEQSFNTDDVMIQLRQFKQRNEDLEQFFEQASSCHKVMSSGLRVLSRVLSEQNDPKADTLYGLEYIPKQLIQSSVLGESFVRALSEFPDTIIKINHLFNVLSTYNAKAQKAESKRQELESRLLEQEKLTQSSIEAQRELELLKTILEETCKIFIGINPSGNGSESLALSIKHHLQKIHSDIDIMTRNNSTTERELEDVKTSVLQAKGLMHGLLKSTSSLKESILQELKQDFNYKADKSHSGMEGQELNSDKLLFDFIGDVKTCLEEVQHLRETQKACASDVLSKLKQELEASKELLQNHAKSLESSSNNLNEELSNLKAQKEAMSIELSNSSQEIKVLKFTLQKYEEDSNAKVSELDNEIIRLKTEIEKYMQELSLLNSSKEELSRTIETLQNKLQAVANEHADSLDSFEQLRANTRKLEDEKQSLEAVIGSLRATINEKDRDIEKLNKDIVNLNKEITSQAEVIREHESGSGNVIVNLQSSLKEKELEAVKLKKELELTKTQLKENEDASKNTTESLKKELELLEHKLDEKLKEFELLQGKHKEKGKELESLQDKLKEKAKEIELLQTKLTEKTNRVEELQQESLTTLRTSVSEKELEVAKLNSKVSELRDEITRMTTSNEEKVKELEEVITRMTSSNEEKVKALEEVITRMTSSNEEKVKTLEEEIVRLGGVNIMDEGDRNKRLAAMEKTKDFLIKKALPDVPRDLKPDSNPLKKLAAFEVDLLVNSKPQRRLEISGAFGGLTQAAIHYFTIDQLSGQITFGNGNQPGSQSSNMLAELMLSSGDDNPIYAANSNGDVLGLSVKVKGDNDRNAREILYNTNVIRTDEIMDAIKGQQIDNFSLWPDLVSCWKWEKSPKGWTLVSIKWRFLFKNIFPEISEALQNLTIKQGV